LKGSICWDRGDVFLEHFSSYIEWIRRFEPISLVFDDPNLRRRGSLNMNESLDCAADWLRRLSVIMEGLPTHLCVKPSPAVYKGEFAFSHTQTFDLVRRVKARRVAVSLDTGAMQINGESPEAVLSALMGCFYHVTICDPGFRPLGKDSDLTFHRHVARSLLASDYPGEITLCFKPEGSLHDSLARSVDFVRDVYFGDNFRKRPSKGNGRSR
jgi:sugar phosphate isomerase/epimerase